FPAVRLPVTAVSVSVLGAVGLLRLALSQPCPVPYVIEVARPLSVPPPLFVIPTVWAGGFAPPWVALKVTLARLNVMTGGGGATTATVATPAAPPATATIETAPTTCAVTTPWESTLAMLGFVLAKTKVT